MSTRSLTTRLSLLFAVSTAAVLFVLGTTLDLAVQHHFQEMDRLDLDGKLALIRQMLGSLPGDQPQDELQARLEAALVGHPGLVVEVRDADGKRLFVRGELPAGADAEHSPVPLDASVRRWWEWNDDDRPLRGLSAPLQDLETGAPTGTVLIAMEISHHHAFMMSFRHILALSILLASIAAAVLGWAVTRAGLRPLQRITALASGLDTERLDARLPEAGVPAEIQALVEAFNSMLARLEAGFRRLSEFSADVAHELRTPIANLTLQTQVALGSTRDADAYREILYSSLEEYERLARMINDMLYLAQADDGRLRPAAEPVELAEQVHTLFDFFDPWAEEQGVTLVQDGQATANGDAAMLRRALSNLVSNAIRHTAQGGQVRVRLFSDARWAYVRVENPGPIVPAAQLERLFDRFYRGAPQRSNAESGSGLGLAIVKAIVAAHGGEVSATSGAFGMRFEVALPAAPVPRTARHRGTSQPTSASKKPARITDS